MVRALGVDLGTKRIGVAVSSGTLATPYEVVQRSGDPSADHRRLGELVRETEAEVVVVGLPLNMSGSAGPAATAAIAEAERLSTVVGVPVETFDERRTTVTAHSTLREMRMRADARKRVIDKVAAAVMLQGWLDARGASRWDG